MKAPAYEDSLIYKLRTERDRKIDEGVVKAPSNPPKKTHFRKRLLNKWEAYILSILAGASHPMDAVDIREASNGEIGKVAGHTRELNRAGLITLAPGTRMRHFDGLPMNVATITTEGRAFLKASIQEVKGQDDEHEED